MNYTEKTSWILDAPVRPKTLQEQEETFQKNIDFVHSLGLKCDSVGWSKLDLASPRTEEIFEKITAFCEENGWKARCVYTREYVNVESDWYELVTTFFKDNTTVDGIDLPTESTQKVRSCVIRAFHELSPTPKACGWEIYLPERFRNFCTQNSINDLDFCWVRDKGKYEAEQYFHAFGNRLIPRMATDSEIQHCAPEKIAEAGGWLPRLREVFHTMQFINLPDCYLAEDLPEGGIAYAYIPSTNSRADRHRILIHKDMMEALVQQRVLPASCFCPAPVFETLPGGYTLHSTEPIPRPTAQYMEQMLAEYEKLKQTPRPVRMVSEKDALMLLRLAKKARKDEFQKALTKAKSQPLLDTDYAPMVPYYAVANGGFLSDEYELLSYDRAVTANAEFHKELEAEELLETKPQGVVIAKCPDGEAILLCSSGEVIRFSHEAPEVLDQWPSLAQFIADTAQE